MTTKEPKKCRAGGKCGAPTVATCTFEAYERNAETGEKIYDGERCDLSFCEEHIKRNAAGAPRCLWHFIVEQRDAERHAA